MTPLGLARRGVEEIGAGVWLTVRGAQGFVSDCIDADDLSRDRLATALRVYVWQPLPMLAALAALIGLIVGALTSQALRRFHAEFAIEPAVARAVARDVVPLVVGVFASGRVSVELAARLGGMRLGRELDALEILGHDPARYVLAPALVAVMAAAPLHMLVASACAWGAAGAALQLGAVTPWGRLIDLTLDNETARAALTGVVKSLLFSVLALGVGASVGSRDVRGPAAIGGQATTAFTWGLLAVFAADAVWTALA